MLALLNWTLPELIPLLPEPLATPYDRQCR